MKIIIILIAVVIISILLFEAFSCFINKKFNEDLSLKKSKKRFIKCSMDKKGKITIDNDEK